MTNKPLTTEQLQELLSVAEKRLSTEQRNAPKTTMEYSEYLNAADAFRETFTSATCAELVRELIELRAHAEHYRAGLDRIWRGLDLKMGQGSGSATLQEVAHNYLDRMRLP